LLKLGLRTKFFLYSNAVIVATIGLVAFLADAHDRSRAYEAVAQRDETVTRGLAVLFGDTLARAAERPQEAERYSARIDRQIRRILSGNEGLIRYMVITDAGGVVTHASLPELVGQPIDGWRSARHAVSVSADGRPHSSCACHGVSEPQLFGGRVAGVIAAAPTPAGGGDTVAFSDERTFEVRVPLGDPARGLGELEIGFSLTPLQRNLEAIPRRLMVVALVLVLLNSVATAVYMEALIRPILSLNQVMRRAGRGDLGARASAKRGDEVGELGAAFNRMMDELAQARDLETVRQTQLAHTEKMAAVGTLAAGVAHEVNNPLGGVLTCLENLRADPANEELRSRYLELIQNGVERIQRTVAHLLDFSRQRPLHLEPISINRSLQHVVELAAYQLRKGGVEVRFTLHPCDPQVTADRSQMEQLFLNLVLNALQAMPDGGTLTLHTNVSDGQALVEVRDTGQGVAPEIRDRIFDPFFTTRGVGGGTGLGLAVSDRIVAAHGGRIEVSSEVGAGAAFRVWLPRFEAKDAGRRA
jgi:two-component system NtrC family sensor kinase